MERYAEIPGAYPREMVLLKGRGCVWKRCRFCDYHRDGSPDAAANFACNRAVLARVTGRFGRLEVVNSGSYPELDAQTRAEIEAVCRDRGIRELVTEVHWAHRTAVPALRARFAAAGIALRIKLGLETFDAAYRREVLDKGIPDVPLADLRAFADQICLLFGLPGQTVESMRRDVALGLAHFDRICINLMVANSAPLQPDEAVRRLFLREVAPSVRGNPRVDLLVENTDLGVG